MFTRAELTKLSGMRHQTTYRMEERGILVSSHGKYSYNQVIFARAVEQIRKALSVTSIKFSENFGNRAQFEIDWINTSAVMYISQGFGLIEHDFSSVEQEWLLPLEKEAFLFEDHPQIGQIFREYFRLNINGDGSTVYVCLNRVRLAVHKIALDKKIRVIEKYISDPQKNVLTA